MILVMHQITFREAVIIVFHMIFARIKCFYPFNITDLSFPFFHPVTSTLLLGDTDNQLAHFGGSTKVLQYNLVK